jgi:phosphoglycolate phosphatase
MPHSIGAVIFDLDGTLADTIGDLGGAVNDLLAARGFPVHPINRYKKMVGNGFAALMKRALPPSIAENEALFRALAEEAAASYAHRSLDTTKPFQGIPELLAALAHRGLLLAVLSNKPDAMTKHMVASLFPETSFLAVAGDKPLSPRKPDPAGALAIAALSGIAPSGWAFVGDSGVDMETGAASGMLPLGASWGYRSAAELRERGAAGILEKPSDLLLYL